jgi:hypothetical protein
MASVPKTARVVIEDQRLQVKRSGLARWFGGSVDVPIEHVVSVAAADPQEARRLWLGIRLAGIQIPGVRTAGIFRRDGELTWWDVGRGGNAIVVTLRDEALTRVVVDVKDPAETVRWLEGAVGLRAVSGTAR